jgi:GntR family transcriptional regulator
MNHHSKLPPLDSASAVPLYQQLRNGIQGLLSSGEWSDTAPIPSERDLTEGLRVSRATVRQAIHELEREGWLVRHQGRGTYPAAQRIEQPLKRITGFSENMRSVGLTAQSKLLNAHLEPASASVARALRLGVGTPVAVVTRLRLAGGAPLMLERAHLNYALTPGLLERDLGGSLYDLLTHTYRLKFARGEETVEAILATGKLARALKLEAGEPLLYTQRTVFTDEGTALEYTERFGRADRCSFRVALEGDNTQIQFKDPDTAS